MCIPAFHEGLRPTEIPATAAHPTITKCLLKFREHDVVAQIILVYSSCGRELSLELCVHLDRNRGSRPSAILANPLTAV